MKEILLTKTTKQRLEIFSEGDVPAPLDSAEHTEEILSEVLNHSSEKIAELRKANVVA